MPNKKHKSKSTRKSKASASKHSIKAPQHPSPVASSTVVFQKPEKENNNEVPEKSEHMTIIQGPADIKEKYNSCQ